MRERAGGSPEGVKVFAYTVLKSENLSMSASIAKFFTALAALAPAASRALTVFSMTCPASNSKLPLVSGRKLDV